MGPGELDELWAAAPETTRRYVMLALRMNRHVDGLVDAWFGPEGPAAEAAHGEPVPAERLLAEARELSGELPDGWIRDQVRGLETVARGLTGERLAYVEEVAGRFGVAVGRADEAMFAAIHRALDPLLPGEGPLRERHAAWRSASIVPPERVGDAVRAVIAAARSATAARVDLPAGEAVEVEVTDDAPWLAFCEYQGGLRSHITVNTSLPMTAFELVRTAMHETYPGHHAERACKERALVRGEGRVEECLVVAPSPQSVVSEGIAEAAPLVVLEGPGGAAVTTALATAGVPLDLPRALAVERALAPLRWVEVEAGRMLHDDGAAEERVAAYLERWALLSPEMAAHMVRFVGDPDARGYEVTYAAGAELVGKALRHGAMGLPELLGIQVRVARLRDAAAGGRSQSG